MGRSIKMCDGMGQPMNGSDTKKLSAARLAYERREWKAAYDFFAEADAIEPLGADDLAWQAWAARWSGRYADEFVALERAGCPARRMLPR
jgi:hypothetical protein